MEEKMDATVNESGYTMTSTMRSENTENSFCARNIISWLDNNAEKIFLFIGLLVIIHAIFFQTVYRYIVINIFSGDANSVVWTEELSRFIFVWITYLAIPIVIKTTKDIRVTVVYDFFNDFGKAVIDNANTLLFILISGVIVVEGLDHISMIQRFPQTSAALHISYVLPYSILPVGFGLVILRLLQRLYISCRESGVLPAIIGIAVAAAIVAPLFLYEGWENAPVVLLGYFAFFLAFSAPIAVSIAGACLAVIWTCDTIPSDYVAQIAYTGLDNSAIMAIPFFVATGVFMGEGGLSRRLLKLADAFLGDKTGGLALATIATCMFFAAISGSGPATVAAIGCVTIPAMIERGYDKTFSVAIVTCAGIIGVMIPPSNPLLIYGISSQESIAKLFAGGVMPGLLCGFALMIVAWWISKKNNWRGNTIAGAKEKAKAFVEARWALMVPVIILGGIYGGIMTPTEAAAVGAFYGMYVGMFVYKEISFKKLFDCSIESCVTSGNILFIFAMAGIFGNIITIESIPEMLAEFITGFTHSKFTLLILLNVILLIIGTFMEALAAILILTPLLLPIVVDFGIDPIHFGVMMTVNLAIGFITPPIGVNLFVGSSIGDVSVESLAKACFPFLIALLICQVLVTFVPEISLFLPNLL